MKKIFLSLVFAMASIMSFTSCSEDEGLLENYDVEQQITEEPKVYSRCFVLNSVNVDLDSHAIYLNFSDVGEYILKMNYNISLIRQTDTIYTFNDVKYNIPFNTETFEIPYELKYGDYIVNVSITNIEYMYTDSLGNKFAKDFNISKNIYLDDGKTHNTYFKLNDYVMLHSPQVGQYGYGSTNSTSRSEIKNNKIFTWSWHNCFELEYNTDYEDENIKIYYDNELITSYNNRIEINFEYNLTNDTKTHTLIISYKDSIEHTIKYDIVQYKFDPQAFFSFKFRSQYTNGGSVSFPGYYCRTATYCLINYSVLNVKPIKCEVYVNNIYEKTITFNNDDIFNSGSQIEVYNWLTYIPTDEPEVITKFTFEFNGVQYTY